MRRFLRTYSENVTVFFENILEKQNKKPTKIKSIIMKKMLFIAAVAMCVMSCGKNAENKENNEKEAAQVEVVEEAQEAAPEDTVQEAVEAVGNAAEAVQAAAEAVQGE